MTNANTDIRKLTEQEAANTAGGVEGYNYGNGWRTVMNLQGGYLAIRTAPSFKYENEIIHRTASWYRSWVSTYRAPE